MLGLFKNKIKEAIKNGAVIIDVRTPHEFDNGKVPGSINIPVDRMSASIERIRSMRKPVVLCCESGARSSQAKNILKSAGINDVHNGGSWQSVLRIIHKISS
ncbi:MAG TPA: rhodanese-like domain-containing protein [Chitinophagaceae bacterium]|nr:rhodanese-like domain-containing protein [Chitinophagaceae bacterium]